MPEIKMKHFTLIERKAPSLVDLCVKVALSHLRFLGDVGETDFHLLDRFLPHCTLDQLTHVENCTQGRDLSPVTDKLWKKFYEKQFGERNTNIAIENMKRYKATFKWRDLYKAKLKDIAEKEAETIARVREIYKRGVAKKQRRQIKLCTKLPPSSKRSFRGGGPGYNLSNVKSSIMKKSKIEFLNSRETKNIEAMKKLSVQRTNSSPVAKQSGFRGNCASSSSGTEFLGRRM